MPSVDDIPSLTPTQIQVLVVLMAEARELNNNELRELAGAALTGADNTKLEKTLGLVETDRSHRPYSHRLTVAGWRVVRSLHTVEPPKMGGSASRTLFTLLRNYNRLLDGRDLGQPGPQPAAGSDAEQRVRAAYAALAKGPGEWVGLADLRDRLSDLDRADVDKALMALLEQDGVRIIPIANTKALKPRDRAAAIRIGGEDCHALSIGQP